MNTFNHTLIIRNLVQLAGKLEEPFKTELADIVKAFYIEIERSHFDYFNLVSQFTLDELNEMETIDTWHFHDLKFDNGFLRHALSRCGIADGAPEMENEVVVKMKVLGKLGTYWKDIGTYIAK